MKKMIISTLVAVALSGCGGSDSPAVDAAAVKDPVVTDPIAANTVTSVRAVLPVGGSGYAITRMQFSMWNSSRSYEGVMQVSAGEAVLTLDNVIPGRYFFEAKGFEGDSLIIVGAGETTVEVPFSLDIPMTLIAGEGDVHAYWSGVAQLSGVYQGVKRVPTGCGFGTFAVSSAELTIAASGSAITIEQNAFFDGVCKFTGTFTEVNNLITTAGGAVKCSNFDEGTWSSSMIRSTGLGSVVAAIDVSIPARACDYTTTYVGILTP